MRKRMGDHHGPVAQPAGTSRQHWVIANPGSIPELAQLATWLSEHDVDVSYLSPISFSPVALASKFLRLVPRCVRTRVIGQASKRMVPLAGASTRRRPALLLELLFMAFRNRAPRVAASLIRLRSDFFDWRVSRMLEGADVVVTRHTTSLRTLRAASRAGIFSVLDYSIVHHLSLAAAQELANRRFPELASSFQEAPDGPRPLKRLDEELSLADRVLTFSPGHAQSMVAAGIAPAKLLICPLGVDAALFPYRSPRKRQPDEPFNVLFVGQITQRKGVGDLVKAFSMLPPDRFTLTLVGPLSGRIEKWLERHNAKVLAPVPRAALALVHAAADAFVLLSTAEGFPQTPLEAMASGLPVIISPQAYGEGGPITDGIDGLVVDPEDHAKVAELLRSLADDPAWAAGLGRAAARRARDFSWERFCEDVYRKVSAEVRTGGHSD